MPVLARTLEAAGLSTILVTNMPFWAEKVGTPRTLAVEFPFGHTLGQPNDEAQQLRVIRRALGVLETAEAPGTIVHSTENWPVPAKEVVRVMAPRVREMMRQMRRRRG